MVSATQPYKYSANEGISSTDQWTVDIVSEQVVVNSLPAYLSDGPRQMQFGVKNIDVTSTGKIISFEKLAGQHFI